MERRLAFGIIGDVADKRSDLDLLIIQNRAARRANNGERGGVILAPHEVPQAGKNLILGCEDDGESALSIGFMKQSGWLRQSTLSRHGSCFRSSSSFA